MQNYDFLEDCQFNVNPKMGEYLNSLDPERRAKQIEVLNREAIIRKINYDKMEGIKSVWNGSEYDPEEDYYFVDYKDNEEVRWVRSPMMTLEDIQNVLNTYPLENIKDLRITPEKFLSRLHENVISIRGASDQIQNSEITERAFRYARVYDSIHAETTGIQSLTKEESESDSDWKSRVKIAQENKDY